MTLVTIIGRGHSGTRAISNTLAASGVYMGEPLNNSWDLVPPQGMYDACCVFAKYVDWRGGLEWNWDRLMTMPIPQEFLDLLHRYLHSVLESKAEYKGWKIPETTLCYPWISRLFPDAKYIFWIRNPRDCIIGGHVTDNLRRFDVPCPDSVCERERRAISWRYQYDLVKATPRPRQWIEVRFEDFVLKQEETLARLEEFLGIPLVRIPVKPEAIDRWKAENAVPTSDDYEKGLNYYDMFAPAMKEYGYEIPQVAPWTWDGKPIVHEEAKVQPYTLPDILRCQDGSIVTEAAQWPKRRQELLTLFQDQVYGIQPGAWPFDHMELLEEGEAFGGKAWRRQIRLFFTTQALPKIDVLVYRPKDALQPVPAFMGLNFYGNSIVAPDTAILLPDMWQRNNADYGCVNHQATERTRCINPETWSAEYLIDNGFALVTACYNDIDPDFDDGFQNGVQALYGACGRRPNSWGNIGSWAWGLSRMLDYVIWNEPQIDSHRVAGIGHSRLGKTALWAGATDERFAMAISIQSGCGGASLARHVMGETVDVITGPASYWFCSNYKKYAGQEEALPVDMHELIALMAPRPVYVSSASEDIWADPKGELLAAHHATPVYRLFGKEGLAEELLPPCNVSLGDHIGYHLHTGPHGVYRQDWEQFVAFAKRHFQ
jgi:hypothetical protein